MVNVRHMDIDVILHKAVSPKGAAVLFCLQYNITLPISEKF